MLKAPNLILVSLAVLSAFSTVAEPIWALARSKTQYDLCEMALSGKYKRFRGRPRVEFRESDSDGFFLTNRTFEEAMGEIFGEPGQGRYFKKPFLFQNGVELLNYLKKTHATTLDLGAGRQAATLDLLHEGIDAYGIDRQSDKASPLDWQFWRRLDLESEFKAWLVDNDLPRPYALDEAEVFRTYINDLFNFELKEAYGMDINIRDAATRELFANWKKFKKTLPKDYFNLDVRNLEDHLVVGDAYHMPFQDGQFDFIYSHKSVLSNMYHSGPEGILTLLPEVLRVLKRGGLILCGPWKQEIRDAVMRKFGKQIKIVADSDVAGFFVLQKK